MTPPDCAVEDLKYVWYNLGGVLFNLLFSAVAIMLWWNIGGNEFMSIFLMLFALMGVLIALMNGIPLKLFVSNDGMNTIRLHKNEHFASVRITNFHTNIVHIQKDNEVLFKSDTIATPSKELTDRSILSMEGIYDFANSVDIDDIKDIIGRQLKYNKAISEEGLKNDWGANIGKLLLTHYANNVRIKARAWAAAGSDARMNGCEMPVIINSGSGNQGITASMPVLAYAQEYNIDDSLPIMQQI